MAQNPDPAFDTLLCLLWSPPPRSRCRRTGRPGAEEDRRPREDLHHHPRGHLQLWLHRSLPLLLGDGGPGEFGAVGGSSSQLSHRWWVALRALCPPPSSAEIPSGHVLLLGPGGDLQSGAAALCLHGAGERLVLRFQLLSCLGKVSAYLFLTALCLAACPQKNLATGYCLSGHTLLKL